jgi:hypothetical protein
MRRHNLLQLFMCLLLFLDRCRSLLAVDMWAVFFPNTK